ncbi:Fe-S-containing hydro-lyase [Peribacillus butanolivorans]|uniref:Fe-S-containing hydro-lyase n=1 Tax=Peribacillus butanolivorans TaxID=421767 RepID=UPI0035E21054
MSKKITIPFLEETLKILSAGDSVLISGTLYIARDAAHKRMYETLETGGQLPFDIENQVFYYAGPTPAKANQVVGSVGPTTSGRMDKYAPALLDRGLKGMIGKGYRNQEVKDAMVTNSAIYLAAIGGSGALIAKSFKNVELIAYGDLGPEAIYKGEIENFPAIVINDIYGADWYELGVMNFKEVESKSGEVN